MLILAFKSPLGLEASVLQGSALPFILPAWRRLEFQDVLPCWSLSEESIKISGLSILLKTSQVPRQGLGEWSAGLKFFLCVLVSWAVGWLLGCQWMSFLLYFLGICRDERFCRNAK